MTSSLLIQKINLWTLEDHPVVIHFSAWTLVLDGIDYVRRRSNNVVRPMFELFEDTEGHSPQRRYLCPVNEEIYLRSGNIVCQESDRFVSECSIDH